MSSLLDDSNQDTSIINFIEYSSTKIIKVAIPVVITLIIDAVIVRFIEKKHGSVSLNRSLVQTMNYTDQNIDIHDSIIIAVGMIVSILVVTLILLTLYYFGFKKIIFIWMIIAVSVILSYYVIMCLWKVPINLNLPIDYISLTIVLSNLVVVGNMSVFWRSPKIFTQVFLIFISVLIALVFLSLPDWTVWMLLVLLVIYDTCVVLCPHGLLNMLIKKSEERNDAIPALVYSTAVYDHATDDLNETQSDNSQDAEEGNGSGDGNGDGDNSERNDNADHEPNDNGNDILHDPYDDQINVEINIGDNVNIPIEESNRLNASRRSRNRGHEKDEDSIRLGLGDFCFYGIMLTRVARLGWDLVILVIFAVILGLSLTLLVLAKLRRPLPALPFSLILGIIFFMIGATTFRPFGLILRKSVITF